MQFPENSGISQPESRLTFVFLRYENQKAKRFGCALLCFFSNFQYFTTFAEEEKAIRQ